MDLTSILKVGSALAACYALGALARMLVWTSDRRVKPKFAPSAGSESEGIFYALFKGLSPSEKESVRKHLLTFAAGCCYHLGVFSALAYLCVQVVHLDLSPTVLFLFRLLMSAGLVSGVGLLLKRLLSRSMRAISTPDDVIANSLVDIFLGWGIATTIGSASLIGFLVAAIFLFFYVPVGKIRHCVFFFCTRTIFGRLFGRRGVLPHVSSGQTVGQR